MLKKHQKKFLKVLERALKKKQKREIWSNEELLKEINKNLDRQLKLNTRQLGFFIGRFQKTYRVFKHISQKEVYYIFVKKNEKSNKRKSY